MKILIFGASGTVGSALYDALSDEHDVFATFNKNKPDNAQPKRWLKFDIANVAATDYILEAVRPDMVISSLTGQFDLQMAVHSRIAAHLKSSGHRLIFMSTANVFDGDMRGGHNEDSATHAISQYGKFKVSCEDLLKDILGEKCLIVRLPKILSRDFATKMIEQIKEGKPVYSNLYINLNTAQNVAQAIRHCIQSDKSGILHLPSHDHISIDDWERQTHKHLGESIDYKAQQLTAEHFNEMMGNDNPDLLQTRDDGNFYLTLTSNDEDIKAKFAISCEEAIKALNNRLLQS